MRMLKFSCFSFFVVSQFFLVFEVFSSTLLCFKVTCVWLSHQVNTQLGSLFDFAFDFKNRLFTFILTFYNYKRNSHGSHVISTAQDGSGISILQHVIHSSQTAFYYLKIPRLHPLKERNNTTCHSDYCKRWGMSLSSEK